MTDTTICEPKENKLTKVVSLKKCKLILNFLSESDDKAIETAKKMLLATYCQGISQDAEIIQAG